MSTFRIMEYNPMETEALLKGRFVAGEHCDFRVYHA